MHTYNEALNIMLDSCKHTSTIERPINECIGLIAAEDIKSPENYPSFNFSARDGFAFRANDIRHATTDKPVRLKVNSTIHAGSPFVELDYSAGTCSAIMTGAYIPDVYDSIIPIEDVVVEKDDANHVVAILINRSEINNDFHRKIGSDIRLGAILLSKGEVVTPFSLMQLHTVGITKIKVFQSPTVILFSTGDEIVDDPSTALLPGQVRNVSAPFIAAECKELGCNFHYIGRLPDDETVFIERIKGIRQQYGSPLIIMSTGAISMGQKDFIPHALTKLKATIYFQNIAMKPGFKFLYAKLDDEIYYLGLPGVPSVAVLILQRLVIPFINKMRSAPQSKAIRAKLKIDYSKTIQYEEWVASTLEIDEQGQLWVTPKKLLEPYRRLYQFYKNNCWIYLPAGERNYPATAVVDTYLLQPRHYGLDKPLIHEYEHHEHSGCC